MMIEKDLVAVKRRNRNSDGDICIFTTSDYIQAKHHGQMLEMFNHYNVWLWHILLFS